MIANLQVSKIPGENNWPLLLDPDNYVAEGSGDNFFIVKNNVIITPEPRNILRGISRGYIFELSKQLDLECVEKNIELYDVMMADEAFMTGTPFCILPVTKINGTNIGNGKFGLITKKLLFQWSENVGIDIETQIKSFSKEITKQISAATPYQFRE